ncbi:MAG: TetR/AcrR family transcriptional regulator, partial [Halobacteria archaeon]|nr:TetR/AcrR family transcriptional regulator [Halobacteria archaeon]
MITQPDTYQRIVDSAKQLMHASSYADVGVAAICEKAEVKKGSFYHFFPSKQELTLA